MSCICFFGAWLWAKFQTLRHWKKPRAKNYVGAAGRRHRIRFGPRTNGVMFLRRRSNDVHDDDNANDDDDDEDANDDDDAYVRTYIG